MIPYKPSEVRFGRSYKKEQRWTWTCGKKKADHKHQSRQALTATKRTWTPLCIRKASNPSNKPYQSRNTSDPTT